MRKLLLAIIAISVALQGQAAVQNDIIIGRVQANGFSTSNDYITTYKTGEMQFIMFDGSGLLSTVRKTGPTIFCSPTQCDAVSGAVTWSAVTSKPTTIAGFGITDGVTTGQMTSYSTVAAMNAGLGAKMDLPTGTTAQYMRGDGSLAAFPAIPAGQVSSDWLATSGVAQILNKPTTLAAAGITDAYPLVSNPAGYLTAITTGQVTTALGLTPVGTAGARAAISLTTTGTGAATYSPSTGVLNVPTPGASVPFNFSQPVARTLAASTSYQATDTSKAAVIVPSFSCQNATTVLAASGCTLQVRVGTGTLTCSTGTVYYTQSLTVALGLLLTQNSTNPVQINLPIGGSFIICPTAGTFTIASVEQSAG